MIQSPAESHAQHLALLELLDGEERGGGREVGVDDAVVTRCNQFVTRKLPYVTISYLPSRSMCIPTKLAATTSGSSSLPSRICTYRETNQDGKNLLTLLLGDIIEAKNPRKIPLL